MDTKREYYLSHARALILGFYTNLWRLVGDDPAKSLPDEIKGYELTVENVQKAMQKPEVRQFFAGDLMTWFEKVYDYGTLGIDDPSTEPEDESETCAPFWDAMEGLLPFIANNTEQPEFVVQTSFDYVNEHVKRYYQRLELDHDGLSTQFIDGEPCLFLTDLAGLAELDEKTVRNMASKKIEGFPGLLKHENRTYVTKKEARAWLVSRGWKETVFLGEEEKRKIKLPDLFHSVSHLLEFLQDSVKKAAELYGVEDLEKQDWFRELEASLKKEKLDLSLDAVSAWGAAIHVSGFDLAMDITSLRNQIEAGKVMKFFNQE